MGGSVLFAGVRGGAVGGRLRSSAGAQRTTSSERATDSEKPRKWALPAGRSAPLGETRLLLVGDTLSAAGGSAKRTCPPLARDIARAALFTAGEE